MPLDLKKALKQRLLEPLPGIEAQYEMAHMKRAKVKPEDLDPDQFRKSAVLLLIYEKQNEFYLPLTERHSYPGVHSAQISLPGGKYEENDQTLWKTALRECDEEIGIREDIELLGALTPVYIPVSNFIVYPYVGFYDGMDIRFSPAQSEVKSILELKLANLKDPGIIKQTTVEPSPGVKIKTPYFDVQGKIVWGATAMILNECKYLLP